MDYLKVFNGPKSALAKLSITSVASTKPSRGTRPTRRFLMAFAAHAVPGQFEQNPITRWVACWDKEPFVPLRIQCVRSKSTARPVRIRPNLRSGFGAVKTPQTIHRSLSDRLIPHGVSRQHGTAMATSAAVASAVPECPHSESERMAARAMHRTWMILICHDAGSVHIARDFTLSALRLLR
jgi:hypothetical protein